MLMNSTACTLTRYFLKLSGFYECCQAQSLFQMRKNSMHQLLVREHACFALWQSQPHQPLACRTGQQLTC